jgi:O-antigen/teichoic acid export membrane protein
LGIIVRQSVSNTIISYIGISLGFVLTILLYPHILEPDEYGLTRILISASYISSYFAHLGFHNIIIRYFPFFKKADPEQHGFLFWAVTIPVIGFLLFAILFFFGKDLLVEFYSERSPLFVDYYLWVLPITLFLVYFEVLNNYLRSLRDSVTGMIAYEIVQRLTAITGLGLYFFEWISFAWFVAFFACSYALLPVITAAQIWRKREFKLIPNFGIIRKSLVKGIANYGLYSLLGGLTTVIIWNVDIMMLGAMAGLDQTGIYAIAFYIASVIAIPQRAIDRIAAPLISSFIKNKEWDQVGIIYRKTSINQLIPGLLIFGLIWIHLDTLYLIMPEVYSAGKWVVFIIGLGKLFEVVTGANGTILLNSKHYRVSFYTNLILVGVTIGANYLLIPIYGIEGAAIASALALFTFNGVKYTFILIRLGLQPFTRTTLGVTVLGFFSLYLCYAVIDFHSLWLNIPLKTLLFVIFYFLPVVYLNVSPDLNNLLRSIVKKLFL